MVRRMRKAEFGSPGTTLREQLVSAVLRGEKTATAGLLVDHERDGESLPEVESVAEWRAAHDRYWRGYADEIRAFLDDPDWDVGDDTLFVAERFRLVERDAAKPS
jgi:uncharacterized protein YhfF